ncbi:methionine ABC transporter ATP-binding protein (plasmid) [Neorhizobium sp. SOG26]|jgi:oligopeptide/dipeptide ABC transporter, ATP-binding protein, C-terminal domain|uniref:ABC transporter ATP-binding protein n=1 Tax=Neorhizobium turbinariae TaxID=2937795 RepID=A0ABT0IMY4_9HYPH|nr:MULTISPECIES: ABC transporter ATP-binding protein [Neorhizobium]AXV17914.1 methionine ABC transporter ATP-binding protein [Neorhizobium sp. SOG26]MCK8779245.1 ABC transporter ATP-binding protein [Neorhizobium turbinariae]
MTTPLLDVRDLTVTINRDGRPITALDKVSFSVNPGEVLGVVGESGAGKSITGAAIIDLLVPPLKRTGGTISLNGDRLDQLSPKEMRRVRGGKIGFIFQDPMTSLNPVITIGRQLCDAIETHLRLGGNETKRRALDWIARVGLPNPDVQFKRYPHQLSGGMRQRIVIALALCANPSLVIADEPTTALDVSVQAHILQLMRDLHRESEVSMMLITHDLGVIAKMADRVAVLYAGRVAEISPVAELFANPSHPYTRGLIRATPMPTADGGVQLDQIPGAMPGLGAVPPGCAFNPRCSRAQSDCRSVVPPLVTQESSAFSCFHPLERDVA